MLNNISLLLKSDLWTVLINWFSNWLVNYGWAIVVFTICLKLVLLPLDVFQRISSQKQARASALMKPELDEINRKYSGNKDKINQESAKLYKKYNVNVGGMCLTMILTLGLTMGVFFTLYGSIRSFGTDKLYSSYQQLDLTYVQAESTAHETWANAPVAGYDTEEDYVLEVAIEAVKDEYKQVSKRNSWLWVKSVWKADASNVNQFVSFEDYAKHQKLADQAKADALVRYNNITTAITAQEGNANGYFVLVILAVAVSFLTQFLSAKILAPKGQKLNTMNKVMLVIIPLSMAIFASTSNVVFTLYIIMNSLMSAIISTILSLIFKARSNKNGGEEVLVKKKNVEVVEYSRNYKK